MNLTTLTDAQLRTLVAVATHWQCYRVGPTDAELRRIAGGSIVTVTTLIARGWLCQTWRRGKRVRRSLRLTEKAWEALEG